jgi:hypothetical protein
MELKEIRCEGDWIQVAQDKGQWWAIVKTVMTRWLE